LTFAQGRLAVMPSGLAQALGPVLQQIAEMTVKIKQYDRQIQLLSLLVQLLRTGQCAFPEPSPSIHNSAIARSPKNGFARRLRSTKSSKTPTLSSRRFEISHCDTMLSREHVALLLDAHNPLLDWGCE
jgi:hypothetical protein